MQKVTIYHNPQCSKSREALEILHHKGFSPSIVAYLKIPLTMEQLTTLRSHFTLEELVRTNEPVFNELELSLHNEEEIMHALLKNPILIQRPIVTIKGKAVIGRPPEKILKLFE